MTNSHERSDMTEFDFDPGISLPDYSGDTWEPTIRPAVPNMKRSEPTIRSATPNVKSPEPTIRPAVPNVPMPRMEDNGISMDVEPEIYEHGHSDKTKDVSRKLSRYLQGVKVREEGKIFDDTKRPWAVGMQADENNAYGDGTLVGKDREGIYLNPKKLDSDKDTFLVHEFAHELNGYLDPVKIKEIQDRYVSNKGQLEKENYFGARTSYEYFAESLNAALARAINGTAGKAPQGQYWKEKKENEYWDSIADDFLQGKIQNKTRSDFLNGEKDEYSTYTDAKGNIIPIPYSKQKYTKEHQANYN